MELIVSHDCWAGPISNFNAWRNNLAKHAGIDLSKMKGYGGDIEWEGSDPLKVLMLHSDCGGTIEPSELLPLATRMEHLLKKMPKVKDPPTDTGEWDQEAYYYYKTEKFAAGLRKASWPADTVVFSTCLNSE